MLQKFALAFKTKTIEFFAEEEEEEDEDAAVDLNLVPEEFITGQRVVVLKPDPPAQSNLECLVSSLLAGVSYFRAAYLQLQAAHCPFDSQSICTADRAAIIHLLQLLEIKRVYAVNPQGQNPNPSALSAQLDAEVQENQNLLRIFETVVNRLQIDIDRKDAESAELKQRLCESEAINTALNRHLEHARTPLDEELESMLSVRGFTSVLNDSYRLAHRFARALIDFMKNSRWDINLVANSIYPDVRYAKPGHCRYAILSYICLAMFESFDLDSFGCEGDKICSNSDDSQFRKKYFLRQFIDHSTLDPLELMNGHPNSDFSRFCDFKYKNVINSGLKHSLFGNTDPCTSVLRHLSPLSPLYELFVNMASSIWMLHKLAWAYDPTIEIFRIGQGTDFSTVYMDSICRYYFDTNSISLSNFQSNLRSKVCFTVLPGFRVGRTVIQCRVYLDRMMKLT